MRTDLSNSWLSDLQQFLADEGVEETTIAVCKVKAGSHALFVMLDKDVPIDAPSYESVVMEPWSVSGALSLASLVAGKPLECISIRAETRPLPKAIFTRLHDSISVPFMHKPESKYVLFAHDITVTLDVHANAGKSCLACKMCKLHKSRQQVRSPVRRESPSKRASPPSSPTRHVHLNLQIHQ
jgi:hypothetical protein